MTLTFSSQSEFLATPLFLVQRYSPAEKGFELIFEAKPEHVLVCAFLEQRAALREEQGKPRHIQLTRIHFGLGEIDVSGHNRCHLGGDAIR